MGVWSEKTELWISIFPTDRTPRPEAEGNSESHNWEGATPNMGLGHQYLARFQSRIKYLGSVDLKNI